MKILGSALEIQGRAIGPGNPTFFVAEIGTNHEGDLSKAKELICQAKYARADAVKFQSFLADEFVSPTHDNYQALKKVEMRENWYRELLEFCDKEKILMFSTATNSKTLEWMEKLNYPCYKVASAHVTYYPLLAEVASLGKPIFLSTGFSTLSEITKAVETLTENACQSLALFHCIGDYPTAPQDVNLKFMDTLSQMFSCPIGLSDHTLGINVSLAAIARGANLIEKHLTLDSKCYGEDHTISLEPEEFKRLVEGGREIEQALGSSHRVLTLGEARDRAEVRRTLHAARNIPKGAKIEPNMLRALRPANGLPCEFLSILIGRKTKRELQLGDPISWDDI